MLAQGHIRIHREGREGGREIERQRQRDTHRETQRQRNTAQRHRRKKFKMKRISTFPYQGHKSNCNSFIINLNLLKALRKMRTPFKRRRAIVEM